ncbi:MAG: DNA polymerase I [Candidatus Magasanikbacteria bacterium]
MKEKKFVIIDGNAIIHRAYHALPPMNASDGTVVNAVYGFTSMLLKVISDLKPDYLTVAFDVAGGTFRDKVYTEYKAHRVKADQDLYDQIPLCHNVVKAFNIPILTKEGYEADDVIATAVAQVKSHKVHKVKSVIVTGDMDLLQLVDDKTNVYALRKGMSDIVMYDKDEVIKKYGFGPERVVDYKSLRGDPSDNIPGVKGVGEKTAKELIEKIGGIEEIYEKIERLKDYNIKDSVINKLKESKEDAFMSKELATIVRDVPGVKFKLEDTVTQDFDRKKISDLLRKFEFFSLVKRIPGMEDTKTSGLTASKHTAFDLNTKTQKQEFIIIDISNKKGFLDEMKKAKVFACKEITDNSDSLGGNLLGLVFVVEEKSYYVKSPDKKVFEIFEDKNKTLVGHDLKKLVKAISNQQSAINNLFDVMIGSYLLNSSTRAHDLKAIVLRELGRELPAGSDQSSLFGVDPKMVAKELELILQVYKKYQKKLEDQEDIGLFKKVEMDLIPVLAEMELNGITVDTKLLNILSKEVNTEIKKTEKKIWKEAGEEFNVASSVQLRDILFEKLELPTEGIKKGKTGYSTSASELEKLHGQSDIIELVENYRELEKLRNTYIDVLPNLINKKTGRIHTTFNQAVTTTGRLSSSEPNLQNIPIRTKLGKRVRDAFIAEPGNILISADYSQIELRIVASLAKDKNLIGIFERGEDVHKATAAILNDVALEDVTKEMRSSAKAINFGVLYGMGVYGLSARTGMSNYEAKDFIAKYFEKFSDVKKYLDNTIKFAKEKGYVETLFGRRRYIPELKASNFQLKNAGERMAINMPVQGTAADVMKMAMIEVSRKLKEKYVGAGRDLPVRLILQVHDELVLEVKKGLENEVSEIVKNAMENVVKLNVPVDVEVNTGKRWGDLK